MNKGEIVIASYKPKAGKAKELVPLVIGHNETLKKLGFVTERAPIIFQAKDETVVEVFEWKKEAFHTAHEHPEVAAYWERMGQICDFVPVSQMAEAEKSFAHFKPLN
jgi:hypothetical protein